MIDYRVTVGDFSRYDYRLREHVKGRRWRGRH